MQQQSPPPENQQPACSERQHSSVAFAVLTHVIRMAVSLAPLAILEGVKDPTRATRLIKGVSILGTGIDQTLWAAKVAMSRDHDHHR
jgi:hypothetical protein